MDFKTTGNRVIIQREATERTTGSGLIVASLVKDSGYYGSVVGVGPGRVTRRNVVIPMSVRIGDRVLFDPNGAITVSYDGVEFVVVKEDDIVTILE